MTLSEIIPYLKNQLPDFKPIAVPIPLSGGYLNNVWRIPGKPASIILKYAPPFAARVPDVAIPPERIGFEAKALKLFGKGGSLEELSNTYFRPPTLIHFDPEKSLLIMEDVGTLPDLREWIVHHCEDPLEAMDAGNLIGDFIGELHARTYRNKTIRNEFNNEEIQKRRISVQYNVGAFEKADLIPKKELVLKRVKRLAEETSKKGRCLIMGDLWPASLLVGENHLRIIDWELCHYGHAWQDVAHLVAHMWMIGQIYPQKEKHAMYLADGFCERYYWPLVFNTNFLRERSKEWKYRTHFGTEILMRTLGPFRKDYLYDGLRKNNPKLRAAIETAVEYILYGDPYFIFEDLWEIKK